jgi:hypothetical protein
MERAAPAERAGGAPDRGEVGRVRVGCSSRAARYEWIDGPAFLHVRPPAARAAPSRR